MYSINPTEQEKAAAYAFLIDSGIAARGARIDVMMMIGYLASVIRFALLDFPSYAPLKLAATRFEEFERLVANAAAESDPVGFYYCRPDCSAPEPIGPPPGVEGTQLGTRAFPPRPNFLDGPPLPVCMVDTTTLFCQTHQGVHVAEDAQIFDLLTTEPRA